VLLVIDKDIFVKMMFTLVQSVISPVDISIATFQSDSTSYWLPIVAISTKWIIASRDL
jgi:hypothetical protein